MKKFTKMSLIMTSLIVLQPVAYACNPDDVVPQIEEKFDENEAERNLDLARQKLEELKLSTKGNEEEINSAIEFIETCKNEISEYVLNVNLMFDGINSIGNCSFDDEVHTVNDVKNILDKYATTVGDLLRNPELYKETIPSLNDPEIAREVLQRYQNEVNFINEALKANSDRHKKLLNELQSRFDELSKKINDGKADVQEALNQSMDAMLAVSSVYDFFNQSISQVIVAESADKMIDITMNQPTKENLLRLFKLYVSEQTSVVDKMNIYRNVLLLSNRGNKYAFRFLEVANNNSKSVCPDDLFLEVKNISEEQKADIIQKNNELNEEYRNCILQILGLDPNSPVVHYYSFDAESDGLRKTLDLNQNYRVDMVTNEKENLRYKWLEFCGVSSQCIGGGWKIHISAQPKSAKKVAELVMPYILSNNVSGKIFTSLCAARYLGMTTGTQGGKFITLYPKNNEEARKITNDLNGIISQAMAEGILNPCDFWECLGDIKVGDTGAIYTRCGSFGKNDDFDLKRDNRWNPIPYGSVIDEIAQERIEKKNSAIEQVKMLESQEKTTNVERNLERAKEYLAYLNTCVPDDGFDRDAPFDLSISFLGQKLEKDNIFARYEELMRGLDQKKKYAKSV